MKQIRIQSTAFAITLLLLASCAPGEKKTENTPAATKEKEVVEVQELSEQTVSRSVEYPASLEANETVHLAPASPGRIEGIFADVGDHVSKESQLIQMDRTQLHQARVQLQNTKADLDRLDTLAKTESIPQQQYDQLKTQYEVARSNVEFLSENTQLMAPFSGVVSGRYFEPGEMFSGTPNTQTGKAAVLSLIQIDRLKAMVEVSENYFPYLKEGMSSAIHADTYPEQSFPGRVTRIHPTINPTSRTFTVEVKVDNRQAMLRPGMFARITFDLGQVKALLVPSISVLKMQGSNERYLFVNKNGVARRIFVEIGDRYDDMIEVISEKLQPGDQIVVTGQAKLIDGAPLEIKN